ncbi:uncharacterized protein A4U43_C10F2920 [Asparagus officinalis]|uniref:Plastocyanin-like domain-containing protein n=1 Tax=Asparagus officinalis TaxID=4686 RepID=A0A5P1E065_ASPOF|nr:uncharacterized protein A4U43_C10F2920 [Asparagus officinalis]
MGSKNKCKLNIGFVYGKPPRPIIFCPPSPLFSPHDIIQNYPHPLFHQKRGEKEKNPEKMLEKTAKTAAIFAFFCCISLTIGEDPYRFFDWTVTFGDIYPLGVKQQGILINGQFPGPDIFSVTNDNLIINVHNNLTEPFLLSWNGVQNRKNSYEDGVLGTTCPIPPGRNFTYKLQVKDQIGSFFYFPSMYYQKAASPQPAEDPRSV